MAEAFIAIGAAIATGGASIGAMFGAGGAAAGGAAAAGGISTLSTVLSTGSALMSIMGGIQQSKALKEAGHEANVQAEQTLAQGSQKRASLAEDYKRMSADQAAIQIANGLNPGVGTPASIAKATTEVAERNLSITRENTQNRYRMQRAKSRGLMSNARAAMLGGFIDAGTTMAGAYQRTG